MHKSRIAIHPVIHLLVFIDSPSFFIFMVNENAQPKNLQFEPNRSFRCIKLIIFNL